PTISVALSGNARKRSAASRGCWGWAINNSDSDKSAFIGSPTKKGSTKDTKNTKSISSCSSCPSWMFLSWQRQHIQAHRLVHVADDDGAGRIELIHVRRAEIVFGHEHAIFETLGALAYAPRGVLVDVDRFLQQVVINLGAPVGVRQADLG